MKRFSLIAAIVTVILLAGLLTGCEALLNALLNPPGDPATPTEQVQGFLEAASADPQVPGDMREYFDPVAGQYVNMALSTYWDNTFFAFGQGPFTILNAAEGVEDPGFPGSTTVTGSVTNFVNSTGYAAVFVMTTDPDDTSADPLIRKITIESGDIPIEKVLP